MSCRRVCRELIERFRFGELDERSAPHLAHLELCAACREEVGVDQLLVRHLRRALRARVEGYTPSPHAWSAILREVATGTEPARSGLLRLIAVGRAMRAMAAGSALVLALLLTNGGLEALDLGFDGSTRVPAYLTSARAREPLEWASLQPQAAERRRIVRPGPPRAGEIPFPTSTQTVPLSKPQPVLSGATR